MNGLNQGAIEAAAVSGVLRSARFYFTPLPAGVKQVAPGIYELVDTGSAVTECSHWSRLHQHDGNKGCIYCECKRTDAGEWYTPKSNNNNRSIDGGEEE